MTETTDASPAPDASPAASTTLAFVAMTIGNVALAFGAWFVRMADTGPAASAFWRIALAAPVLVAAAMATGWRPARTPRMIWGLVAIAGLCFAADLSSWHFGILRTTLANATLFGNSTILFFPIYGFIAARALPTRMQGMALLLAAIGGALLMGRSYTLDPRHLGGDLFCLLAGILYTAYFVVMARVRETNAPIAALAMSTLGSLLPLLILAMALGERIMPQHWGPLIALALCSQLLGQGLMIYALGKLSPLVLGIGLLVQPLVGATVGWVVYGEQLGVADLIGAVLVAVALVLVRRPTPLGASGVSG